MATSDIKTSRSDHEDDANDNCTYSRSLSAKDEISTKKRKILLKIRALSLPKRANINPRSLYNSINEFQTYVTEEDINVAFVSETWERGNKNLPDLITLTNHTVISNIFQRKCVGGRPALVINNEKFTITTPVESAVSLPWGLEANYCNDCIKMFNKRQYCKKHITSECLLQAR